MEFLKFIYWLIALFAIAIVIAGCSSEQAPERPRPVKARYV